jgi:thioredoxin 1
MKNKKTAIIISLIIISIVGVGIALAQTNQKSSDTPKKSNDIQQNKPALSSDSKSTSNVSSNSTPSNINQETPAEKEKQSAAQSTTNPITPTNTSTSSPALSTVNASQSTPQTIGNNSQTPPPTTTKSSGIYTQYNKDLVSKAENQPTVLFFHASWCPTCKAMEKDLNEKADQLKSSGVQVLKIDYDTANDLKKQFGVTSQSTFVKVDKDGNKIKTTQGITKLSELSSFATSN